jgi:biopolymer transport protein ExbD
MKLHSPIPHRKPRIEIIPLIDIMFFLLASFMLVSMAMVKLAGVKMSLPQAASAEKESKPDFIPISISAGGEIYWDKEQKVITKEQIPELIKPRLQANKDANKEDLRIYINADRDATHGTVIEVLDRVRQAGVSKVSFAIKPGAIPVPGAVLPAPENAPAATPPAPAKPAPVPPPNP